LLRGGSAGVNVSEIFIRRPIATSLLMLAIDAIRRILPDLQKQLPPAVHLIIRGDRSQNIRETFKDVQFTMAATIALVVLVIFPGGDAVPSRGSAHTRRACFRTRAVTR